MQSYNCWHRLRTGQILAKNGRMREREQYRQIELY